MWKVTRLDDGSHLAECERCWWKRTYRTMGWGKRAASLHYASHRETRGEAVSTVTAKRRKVAAHLREVDPEMFDLVCYAIGSRSLTKVGAYVEETDPVGYVGMWMNATYREEES